MDADTPDTTVIARGGAQALAELAELLATREIRARILTPPDYNPNH